MRREMQSASDGTKGDCNSACGVVVRYGGAECFSNPPSGKIVSCSGRNDLRPASIALNTEACQCGFETGQVADDIGCVLALLTWMLPAGSMSNAHYSRNGY